MDAYIKNYSQRSIHNRDPRVVMGYGNTELKGDSQLQVAPHSNKYINPKNLLVSKTPNPPRSRGGKVALAASGYSGFRGDEGVPVRDSN